MQYYKLCRLMYPGERIEYQVALIPDALAYEGSIIQNPGDDKPWIVVYAGCPCPEEPSKVWKKYDQH